MAVRFSEKQFLDFAADLVEENFPKGKSDERGHANVLVSQIYLELKARDLIVPDRNDVNTTTPKESSVDA